MQKVIDIRRQNDSHLLGFTRKLHLRYLCERGFGIAYEHIPQFSPSKKLLTEYLQRLGHKKCDETAWGYYVEEFNREVLSQPICQRFNEVVDGFDIVCLLCSEETADRCHRRLLAEQLMDHVEGTEIWHL